MNIAQNAQKTDAEKLLADAVKLRERAEKLRREVEKLRDKVRGKCDTECHIRAAKTE